MIIHKGRYIFGLLATVAVLLIMSACGSGSSGSSSQTPAQVLQNSSSTMKQLKTAHVDMKMSANVGAVGITPTAGSTTPTNITFNINATGDAVLPDQASLKLTMGGFSGLNLNIAEVLKGGKVYIQISNRQWYVIDKSIFTGRNGTSNPLSGASVPDFNKLLDIGQHAQLADHGDQSLNGETLRHITVALDKNAMQQLLQSTGQLNGLLGSNAQKIQQVMDSIKTSKATLDFWIDENTSYVHRFEMKFNMNLDLSSFAKPGKTSTGNTPSTITIALDSTVDLSKFNDPSITVTVPANAVPTDKPGTIFSNGQ
jgi:hypothetical protein